ncbi:hypothetical protein FOBRF1_013179 [Fusarium oxysporum]
MTLKKVSISVTKLTCTAKPSTILGLASILCATTGKGTGPHGSVCAVRIPIVRLAILPIPYSALPPSSCSSALTKSSAANLHDELLELLSG